MTRLFSIIAGLVLLFAVPAFAGSLEIQKLQIRATAPGMKATGGYLTITNHGKADDALISASADFAGRVELHEMLMDGDVMKMRERKAGIAVPAGSTVMLKPGGLHLMLMELAVNSDHLVLSRPGFNIGKEISRITAKSRGSTDPNRYCATTRQPDLPGIGVSNRKI